jgi:hypothetical protein
MHATDPLRNPVEEIHSRRDLLGASQSYRVRCVFGTGYPLISPAIEVAGFFAKEPHLPRAKRASCGK